VDKARRLAETLAMWQGKTTLKLVPLAGIQREIVAKCDPSMRVVLYRRAMLRLAERIAAGATMSPDSKKFNNALALVTGDAVGQVASQTLENIAAVSAAATMPIFRPLAGDDKDAIVTLARRVGTYDISIEPHEDCCSVFMPPRAVTRSTAAQAVSEEAKCDLSPLMEAALSETETVEINPFQTKTAAAKAAAK
jgi:thiamine biosynthesis protein ThiI